MTVFHQTTLDEIKIDLKNQGIANTKGLSIKKTIFRQILIS